MQAYELIMKKRDGNELSSEEIRYLVKGFVSGAIPDYQITAFLMAVFFQKMSFAETAAFTEEMVASGEVLQLPVAGRTVDKHSTGGVGDKTTLIIAPLVASCGVVVAKMSGRGLGHTGGTIDKLESIPGFSAERDQKAVRKQLQRIGLAITAQTRTLVPADRRLYALRDTTATVDSIPLIASSIMSKKIASGADGFVLDVKVGRGAFMKRYDDAMELARTMVAIGNQMDKPTVALLTEMDQPLGWSVGNALEVREAVETLKGKGAPDLTEICLQLGVEMLLMAGAANCPEQARRQLEVNLDQGAALDVFRQFVRAQGGDERVIDDPQLLPQAEHSQTVRAPCDGWIAGLDALEVGLAAVSVGAGRTVKDEKLDASAGIVLHRKRGEQVQKGELLAVVYGSQARVSNGAKRVLDAYHLTRDVSRVASLDAVRGRVDSSMLSADMQ